jgi:Protein of unknown function (DUF5672)
MSRLPLAQVTLCAVDTRTPALAAQALVRSMAHCDFGRVVLFTHDWLPTVVLPGVEIVQIETLPSGADHSRFVLRQLPQHVQTSHVLITQWDGFVLNPAAWSDEFLVYDYIGAPWPDQPEPTAVGQGGFSLRSRRFLRAGTDLRIEQEHPDDAVMCRLYRGFLEDVHGIRFAPPLLARRFACDDEGSADTAFGFLGASHLPRVLDAPALQDVLERLPDAFFATQPARRLAQALLLKGLPNLAREALRRRLRAGSAEPATRLLMAAAQLAAPFTRAGRSARPD